MLALRGFRRSGAFAVGRAHDLNTDVAAEQPAAGLRVTNRDII